MMLPGRDFRTSVHTNNNQNNNPIPTIHATVELHKLNSENKGWQTAIPLGDLS